MEPEEGVTGTSDLWLGGVRSTGDNLDVNVKRGRGGRSCGTHPVPRPGSVRSELGCGTPPSRCHIIAWCVSPGLDPRGRASVPRKGSSREDRAAGTNGEAPC